MPATAEEYLPRLEAGLADRLEALAAAVEAGEITIERGGIRLPRRKPAPKDPRLPSAHRALADAIGTVQLSGLMVEIDGLTQFSWTLLGRPARSEKELVTLYTGLLGLGSDLSVAELARMTPSVSADSLEQMVLKIEADGRLRTANDVVLRFMRDHRVAGLWGQGLFASADMMSLEATRYLGTARLDPRRRTYAVGTYAHVLDQWGILYDQPIVLNRRQAGAAIEGALRQKQVDRLERVAVDTHGFTYLGSLQELYVGLRHLRTKWQLWLNESGRGLERGFRAAQRPKGPWRGQILPAPVVCAGEVDMLPDLRGDVAQDLVRQIMPFGT